MCVKDDIAALSGSSFSTAAIDWPEIKRARDGRIGFFVAKRSIDLCFAVLALPILIVLSLILLVVNVIWNPGPVFFRQRRMGRDGKAFVMWKFRTMLNDGKSVRAADAPLDEHRITPLGRVLRRSKLDELPNILNILTGDMSLIGPRPDAFEHATEYLFGVAHYRNRFVVRPGITGLAQVRGGYADSKRSVARKVNYDKFYIQNSSFRLELYILAMTFAVVFSGFGQR